MKASENKLGKDPKSWGSKSSNGSSEMIGFVNTIPKILIVLVEWDRALTCDVDIRKSFLLAKDSEFWVLNMSVSGYKISPNLAILLTISNTFFASDPSGVSSDFLRSVISAIAPFVSVVFGNAFNLLSSVLAVCMSDELANFDAFLF